VSGAGGPLRRSREGVLHDPGRPAADGAALVRAGLRSGRRFRVTDEETGEDCTVEVLAEFLLGACAHRAGLLLGSGALPGAVAPGATGAAR